MWHNAPGLTRHRPDARQKAGRTPAASPFASLPGAGRPGAGVGFYALAFGAVAAIGRCCSGASAPGHVRAKQVGLLLAGLAILRGVSFLDRARHEAPPVSIELRPAVEPQLRAGVQALADAVRALRPTSCTWCITSTPSSTRTPRLLGLRPGRTVLGIGIGLLAVLRVDELRAVLGHELGTWVGATPASARSCTGQGIDPADRRAAPRRPPGQAVRRLLPPVHAADDERVAAPGAGCRCQCRPARRARCRRARARKRGGGLGRLRVPDRRVRVAAMAGRIRAGARRRRAVIVFWDESGGGGAVAAGCPTHLGATRPPRSSAITSTGSGLDGGRAVLRLAQWWRPAGTSPDGHAVGNPSEAFQPPGTVT